MHETLYAVARRMFDQDARDRINARLARARRSMGPLLKRVHGTFDATTLREELTRVLPPHFDTLMVHCAFDGLLPMYTEWPGQLVDMLRSFVGPDRTLAMPAFTYQVPGRDLPAHFEANRRFDARRQPSQMGLVSEIFRRTPGVVRSLHPTHSVCALGPRAVWLTEEHHRADLTFGAGSPFAKMAEMDTVILGLGKPYYRTLTQTHVPEDLLGERFPVRRSFHEVDMVLVDAAGEHPFRFRIDITDIERKPHRLSRLVGDGELVEWRYHGAPLFWAAAGPLTASLCRSALAGKTVYAGPTLG